MPLTPRSLRPLVVALLLTSSVAAAASAEEGLAPPGSPEAEGQAATADSDVPGLDEGAAVFERLRVTQEILASGSAKEAAQQLDSLIRRIDTLLMRGAIVLPTSYLSAGELWVPVKADTVQIRLDVPEILPRPNREGRREAAEERLVDALRVDWLPLGRTRTLLTDAAQGVSAQAAVAPQSRERLAEALAGIRQTTRLKDPVMEAYRAVKIVLAGGESWQDQGRDELRQAADALSAADPADPAARELANLAETAAPDVGRLAVTAAQLRGRIAARQSAETSPGGAANPVSGPVPDDDGTGDGQAGSAPVVSGER